MSGIDNEKIQPEVNDFNREEKQIDTAIEAIKQQITLSVILITASLTFANLIQKQTELLWYGLPYILIPLGLNIIFGILSIMSISYYLVDESDYVLNRRLVRIFGILQNLVFAFSVIAMVVLVVNEIFSSNTVKCG